MVDNTQHTKDVNLDAAIADIEKSFGKGSIMSLGNRIPVKIDSISTGVLSLDIALGIGGIPKGRVTEIFGPESSGKCIKEDSYVLSMDGWTELNTYNNAREGDFSPVNQLVYSIDGFENTEALYNDGYKNTIKVKTRFGFEIEGTYEHPLLVFDGEEFVFKKLQDMKEGDYLCIQRNQQVFSKKLVKFPLFVFIPKKGGNNYISYSVPDSLNKEGARFFAYIIGEGHIGSKKGDMTFSNSDENLLEDFSSVCLKLFNYIPRLRNTPIENSCKELQISSVFIKQFLKISGITMSISKDKVIPSCILHSPKEIQREFLRTYFDCEGSVSEDWIELTSASEKLTIQLQLQLLNFGILARRRKSFIAATNGKNIKRPYWTLYISGKSNLDIFQKEIDFSILSKKCKLRDMLIKERKCVNTNADSIPNMKNLLIRLRESIITDLGTKTGGSNRKGKGLKNLLGGLLCDRIRDITSGWCNLTYVVTENLLNALASYKELPEIKKLKEIVHYNYFFDPITELSLSSAYVLDFVIPKNHVFTSNGFISHNTTLTLHIIAEAMKNNGRAAFIDAEHALDIIYAAALGVDTKRLLVSQPDNGEQALDIVEKLVLSNALDVIVIDSVAALVPRSEIEGEMGDASMAVQARLMSKALRKLTAIISKSNTAVIFINQLRQRIGIMFGNPDVTPGGNALKFYASVRLDIRKMTNIKVKEEVIGSHTKIKVVKSKVSPPFRETEVNIRYGKGVYIAEDLVDLAVTYGIIKRAGAWYTLNEDRFQGKEQLVGLVEKDTIVQQILRTEILQKVNSNEPAVSTTPVVGKDCDNDGVIIDGSN